MAEQTQTQSQDPKKDPKTNNRWTNISSDQDQSESEHSEKQQQIVAKPKQQSTEVVQPQATQEEVKKREHNIVPFDAKKKFRGEFANIKTVKGGFKAQKLQQRKFRLDTVKNPFQVDDESSDEERQQQQVVEETKQQQTPAVQQDKTKKVKKSKKQQEKEQLQALLKELNVQGETKAEDGEKKKKKKKAKKEKVEGEQQPKEETKPEQVQSESLPAQEAVNRQAIEEVLRKKAEAAKNAAKKTGKVSVAANARKAIVQREAKNKQKKVYIDL